MRYSSKAWVNKLFGYVFDLLGASDRLKVIHPDCAHDFPPEVRREAYAFIAAGSVVTKNVPDYALMIGVPAKISPSGKAREPAEGRPAMSRGVPSSSTSWTRQSDHIPCAKWG